MIHKNYLLILGVSAVMGAAWPNAVQAAPPPDRLSTIVVTATRRKTTIQTTAASITAVTAAQIASRGLIDFTSLAQSVPGIAMRTSGPGQTEFEMRGLNSSGGNTSMVGFYLSDIPLSSPASAQLGKVVIDPNLYDLNRVEILRGPQGTLYGASSMGGTVRLVPNLPRLNSFNVSGEEIISDTADGGNFNHEENGMINLPLGSSAALRIVGSFTRDSGWIKRLVIQNGAVAVDGPTFDNASRPTNFYTAPLQETVDGANTTVVDSIRASLLWKPTENLSIIPLAMYQLTHQGAPNTVDVNGVPTHPHVPTANAHYEIYDTPEPQRDRFTLGSLTVRYRAPWFTVTSATGYWNRGLLISQDASEEAAAAIGVPVYNASAGGIGQLGPAPNGPGATELDYTRQTSEELRVASRGSARFQWLAGYFYQDLHSNWEFWSVVPELGPVLQEIGLPAGPYTYVDFQPQIISQNAEFAELSYKITPNLMATVGARHYHYSLAQRNSEWGLFTVYSFRGNSTPYNTAFSNKANGTVPSFNLRYTINKDDMVYISVSKGFRLGGVNQPIPVAAGTSSNFILAGNECGLQAKLLNNTTCSYPGLLHAPKSYGSDTVWSYEFGEKSSWFRHRMTVDVSAYFERWLNPQLATNLAGFGITANGGDVHIKGLEAELHALLTRNWDVLLNFGYTDAKFVQSSAIIGFPSGLAVPDTPKSTASLVLHYKRDLNDSLSIFGLLEWNYVGSRTDAPYGETLTLWNYNNLLVHLPSYNLGKLRIGLIGGRWTAAFFVNNIANKEILLDPEPQIFVQSPAFMRYTVNRPRTFGIDLTYRFH